MSLLLMQDGVFFIMYYLFRTCNKQLDARLQAWQECKPETKSTSCLPQIRYTVVEPEEAFCLQRNNLRHRESDSGDLHLFLVHRGKPKVQYDAYR